MKIDKSMSNLYYKLMQDSLVPGLLLIEILRGAKCYCRMLSSNNFRLLERRHNRGTGRVPYIYIEQHTLEDLQRVEGGLKKFFSFKLSTVSLTLCSVGVNSRPRLFAFSLETWYTSGNGCSSTHLKIPDKKFKIN